MSVLPPELMSAEEREARAAELRDEIQRQWVRFAITEGVVIWLPFGLFLALYVAEVVPERLLVPGAIVTGAAMVMLMLYWVFARIRPRSSELARLEGD
jgi:hypothetical protein